MLMAHGMASYVPPATSLRVQYNDYNNYENSDENSGSCADDDKYHYNENEYRKLRYLSTTDTKFYDLLF